MSSALGMPGRRAFLLGSAASMLTACDGCHDNAHASGPRAISAPLPAGWRDLPFESRPGLPDGERAYLLTPPGASNLPILLALHGRGETAGGLEVGAAAWLKSYELDHQYRRLLAPPLKADDFRGMADAARVAAMNASLARAPFLGVVTACPWCPDLEDPSPAGTQPFGSFLVGDLLARARSITGQKPDRERTGIDGISMGGRQALFVGLMNPEVFGVVGAMQPALRVEEAPLVARLARDAIARAPIKLRLLTSEADYFKEAVLAVSDRLSADGVPHERIVVPGEHGYEFNRGPGGIEMLLWHDRLAQSVPPV